MYMSSLSPLDGRYLRSTEELRGYFSEEALNKARLTVEIGYLIGLSLESGIKELPKFNQKQIAALWGIVEKFSAKDASAIKAYEKKTNHDVKAVEYFLQEKVKRISGLTKAQPFIHFGLTSEDVNNLAYGILIQDALKDVILPELKRLNSTVAKNAKRWSAVALLSLTHGQPATPTTVGKEFAVFEERLARQLDQLKGFKMQGKFGGAVGNYLAHRSAYPDLKWESFGRTFVRSLGLDPLAITTQINPHDDIAELSHILFRINTIMLDLSRDIWLYISRGVFGQKLKASEVGSSTMPHKVNPIDFENAEGNVGLSNALFAHFAEKLPVSRLQRDLSDSTVQRSIGSAFGYHLLAVTAMMKGLGKISLNRSVIKQELADNPEVLGEAIQTVLRKNGVVDAYEQLKALTRGERIGVEEFIAFVHTLKIKKVDRDHLVEICSNYPQ